MLLLHYDCRWRHVTVPVHEGSIFRLSPAKDTGLVGPPFYRKAYKAFLKKDFCFDLQKGCCKKIISICDANWTDKNVNLWKNKVMMSFFAQCYSSKCCKLFFRHDFARKYTTSSWLEINRNMKSLFSKLWIWKFSQTITKLFAHLTQQNKSSNIS